LHAHARIACVLCVADAASTRRRVADAEESVRDLLRSITDAVDATEALKVTEFEVRVFDYMRCVRAHTRAAVHPCRIADRRWLAG
jgi:hypothetical protein